MNQSKNGQNYYQFDYDNFNEKGLKPFIKAMKQAGAEVVSVSATNKQRRANGLFQKIATLHMASGQSVSIKIGIGGDLTEIKLNSRLHVPIKDKRTEKSIAKEISEAAQRNQAKFDKSQARALAKVKTDTGPTAKKSATNGAKELQDRLAKRQAETTRLVEQRDKINTSISDIRSKIESTKQTITSLQAEEQQLVTELEALEARDDE